MFEFLVEFNCFFFSPIVLVAPWLGGVHGVLSIPSNALRGQPGVFLVYLKVFFPPSPERSKTGGSYSAVVC